MRKIFLLFFLSAFFVNAQAPEKLSASEIHQKIKELNFLGSVLYVAAHPDDENTQLISYFSNHVNARTAYLSLTRGDGGQNLIGPEIREQLGVIRTQELLAARRIDGGEQFFSRANDFGYSKTPEETLEIWNKEEVLSDVVWTIRKFKPDVIINRFDHRTSGNTHGHHTSSAILSMEAFNLANDKTAFPEQLEYTETFKPQRLFFNTSSWFYGSQEAFEEADKTNFLKLETGKYFPSTGMSNSEIAALSRSQHQSQGFGSTARRGKRPEYLELIKGEIPDDKSNIFDGINTNWDRIEGGAEIGQILNKLETEFSFRDPSKSIPALLEAYQLITNLQVEHWKNQKAEKIKEIIAACAGLYLEAAATTSTATLAQEVPVQLEAINRSDEDIKLLSVELRPNNSEIKPDLILENNEGWNEEINLKIPEDTEYTSPYWLKEKGTLGMYAVKEQKLRGLPETRNQTRAVFTLSFNDVIIPFEKEIVYKYNDAVTGENYQPFEITPPVSTEIGEDILIFDNAEPKEVSIKVTAGKNNIKGQLQLNSDENWKISPEKADFEIREKGNSFTLNFKIFPPEEQDESILKASTIINGKEYNDKIVSIDYPHIPLQTLTFSSEAKLTKLEIEKKGEKIGYIKGAGDVVPESLERIGYDVSTINPQAISEFYLRNFDAVVVGIRAYNTVEELKYRQNALLNYVKNGGTLIVQYNTTRGLSISNIAPFDLEISNDRVTEEDAEVRFLAKDHPVLNTPNKITRKDFENWVQERGLYFPDKWSDEFTPVLAMNDKGDTEKEGSLLVAEYGDGHYIYTGLSFFREFPAGVPGAYRLFANLISIGK